MADSPWLGEGPDFTLPIGGQVWTLDTSRPQPGLTWSDGRSQARLLSLRHIGLGVRRDDRAFDGSSLVAVERHRRRIQATFTPRSCPDVNVRAAWEPMPAGDGMDLEIQVFARTSEVLPQIAIGIVSRWSRVGDATPPKGVRHVEWRQVGGRQFRPEIRRSPGFATGRDYVEMVQPHDCARRAVDQSLSGPPGTGGFTIEHDLFGHDLEKGVVLRGRIRGVWIDAGRDAEDVRALYEAFVEEPPALGP